MSDKFSLVVEIEMDLLEGKTREESIEKFEIVKTLCAMTSPDLVIDAIAETVGPYARAVKLKVV
jgi:hypothetical protein